MQPISGGMKTALNVQIGNEYSNCLAYWSMEWALRAQALCGMAKWMHDQGSDERHHGKKFAYYLIDRGDTPSLSLTQPTPQVFYGQTPLEIFSAALELEKKTSQDIENLMAVAEDDEDCETESFLVWYVDEQVEEEKTLRKFIKRLQEAGSDYAALLILDKKMGG